MEAVLQDARTRDLVVDYDHWERNVDDLALRFAKAAPFPHIVLPALLEGAVATQMERDFPGPESGSWTHYKHINENKQVKSRREEMPPSILRAIDELNGGRFRALLSLLTGIEGLLPDPDFAAGGGLCHCGPGSFLNVHTDFTVHPYHRNLRRRVNLILYLNSEWDASWGGYTELWDSAMRSAVVRVPPALNTCLLFDTEPPSHHGHPDPIRCPEGVARRTLALYYFTREASPRGVATDYKARPGDGALKSSLIFADKLLLRAYYLAKRKLGVGDRVASRALEILSAIVKRIVRS